MRMMIHFNPHDDQLCHYFSDTSHNIIITIAMTDAVHLQRRLRSKQNKHIS